MPMKSTARRSSTRRRLRRKATIVTQLPNMTHERYSIEEGSRLMKVNLLSSPYRKRGGGSLSIPGRRNPLLPPGIKGVRAVERRPPFQQDRDARSQLGRCQWTPFPPSPLSPRPLSSPLRDDGKEERGEGYWTEGGV